MSLPTGLLKLAYLALVRPHLEYCSGLFAGVAKTHQAKLEVVQKISARVITGAPHDAHAAPLLEDLELESLETRRNRHICAIVDRCLNGRCHPAVCPLFIADEAGHVSCLREPKTAMGKKTFSYMRCTTLQRLSID